MSNPKEVKTQKLAKIPFFKAGATKKAGVPGPSPWAPKKEFFYKEGNSYLLPDFIEIQRKSFFNLLKNGLIEEFSKRNPITNKNLEVFFFPEFYQLTSPEYNPKRAILQKKDYSAKLYIPAQLTDKTPKKSSSLDGQPFFEGGQGSKKKLSRPLALRSQLKWVLIGNLPLMTKRGHFVLNGSPRVIVNQILRSPGIYYQMNIKELYDDQWDNKPKMTYKRFYADLICLRGTWLRIEVDKNKDIWAQMKKVPKIPLLWFLLAMGLTERIIFKSIKNPLRLLSNFNLEIKRKIEYKYVTNPSDAWKEIHQLIKASTEASTAFSLPRNPSQRKGGPLENELELRKNELPSSKNPGSSSLKGSGAKALKGRGFYKSKAKLEKAKLASLHPRSAKGVKGEDKEKFEPKISFSLPPLRGRGNIALKDNSPLIGGGEKEGRNWIFKRFMNPRSYDLGSQGRLNFNRKLGLSIAAKQTTLTAQDLLFATDYLLKVEKGLKNVDDIDHLKNRRVRTSGELIQIQIGIGLVRLEKIIRDKLVRINAQARTASFKKLPSPRGGSEAPKVKPKTTFGATALRKFKSFKISRLSKLKRFLTLFNRKIKIKAKTIKAQTIKEKPKDHVMKGKKNDSALAKAIKEKAKSIKAKLKKRLKENMEKENCQTEKFNTTNLVNTKAFNGALREFFGSSPLSQFMDQLNPLAEITHKRRLSSMGPGGVTRDSATLAIRGIHPTHYGRICPIETPEGKNTGLVNSLTTYSRTNPQGFLESPFYKVFKGQIQKNGPFGGIFFLSSEQEEKLKVAAADVATPSGRIAFLPKSKIPAKVAYGDTISKISRNTVEYIGVSPIQMISIATSLIPFVEHDDANRALMGYNMQRQAVPLIRTERPLVGTGLESRAVSDSGHAIIAKESGYVTYVSGKKIVLFSLPF